MKTSSSLLLLSFFAIACGPGMPGTVIATTTPGNVPQVEAVDDERLYWMTSDTLFAVDVTGGTPTILAAGEQLSAMTTDADTVYWLSSKDGYTFKAVAKVGGEVRVLNDQEDLYLPILSGLATDGVNLYWSNSSRVIRRLPVAGGVASDFADTTAAGADVAIEGETVFASLAGGIARYSQTGEQTAIVQHRGDNTLTSSLSFPQPPNGYIYWVESGSGMGDGQVLRAPTTGGAVEVLADKQHIGSGLSLDDRHVYWATPSQFGYIRRIPLDGGGVEDFAYGQDQVGQPRVHGGFVYWIDFNGNIHRAQRER